jgi:RNA polymerase sigma factor (sigma-70 family)
MTADQDRRLADAVDREQSRLRAFIRRRVPDREDAEDILQDVFSALVEADRLLTPIDHLAGWLFRVARNRIADLWRRKRAAPFSDPAEPDDEDEMLRFEERLPSPDGGPDAVFARALLLEALEAAIAELPPEQRDVFVAHEIDGLSFKEIAAATGVNVNTLLARKRYAVLRLRERLAGIYDDLEQA